MSRWMRLALKVSTRGRHQHHRIGAVLVRGGSVLSVAANYCRTWAMVNLDHHAEARALRGVNAKGATIYIAREGRRMARPCACCMKEIRQKGVAKVVYLGWDGMPVEERV